MHIDAYSSSASRKFRTTSFAIAQLWHGLAMTRSLLLLVSIDISEARPLWQLWQRLLWEEDISEPTLADLAVTLSNYCRLSLVLHPALLHIELDRTGIICFSTIFSPLFLSVLFLTLIFGAEFHAAFLLGFALARPAPVRPGSSAFALACRWPWGPTENWELREVFSESCAVLPALVRGVRACSVLFVTLIAVHPSCPVRLPRVPDSAFRFPGAAYSSMSLCWSCDCKTGTPPAAADTEGCVARAWIDTCWE